MDTYHSTLAQSATANLGHQRNQIRLAALQAVGALLLADKRYSGGGIRAWAEPLLPALMQLTNDRTPSVRQELGSLCVSAFLEYSACNNSFFLLFLIGQSRFPCRCWRD
jgi:hypothetical protein